MTPGLVEAAARAMGRVVEVAVPVALRRTFHYCMPAALGEPVLGARVRVPFNRQQIVGYIVGLDVEPPPGITLADIRAMLDPPDRPTFSPALLSFLRQLSEYYRAPLGEAMRGAHPPGTNEMATRALGITASGRLSARAEDTPDAARRLLARLEAGPRGVDELEPVPGATLIKRLCDAGWVERVHLERSARVAVKTERMVQAIAPLEAGASTKAPLRKRDEILAFLVGRGLVPVRELRERFPHASDHLRSLLAEGRVAVQLQEVVRDPYFAEPVAPDIPPTLSRAQAVAVEAIQRARGFIGFLLHGVTGSGKTEVYLRAIAHCLAQGRGALVVVPEIGLTPQLVRRFRARLGDALAVLHSGLTDADRHEHWRRLHRGEVRVVIGARSAIFAPVERLGLIIVDEEHDQSYKSGDGVRYNGRDMALLRGSIEGAVVVLGSATPSLESTHNASAGKLTRLVLAERPTGGRLPEVTLIDLRRDRPPRDAASFLSLPLRNALAETLGRGEQSILFLNRRGFSNFVQCARCGHALECHRCAVAQTWHRASQLLRCHYCDAVRALPGQCPDCQAPALGLLGHGTERVEDALRLLYPMARIARLDRDTAAGRGLTDVLDAMRDGRIDILVGTQMVTKGHDFPAVTLVGVVAADASLAFPDFRAGERTFQLLGQVAGRAGRGSRPGRVLVQTWNPDTPCLQAVRRHDYAAFCTHELQLRREMGYPPYGHAVAVRLDAARPEVVEATAKALGQALRACIGPMVDVTLRGPAPAPLVKLRGRTRWSMLLTSPRRNALRQLLDACDPLAFTRPPDVHVHVDVDPQDFL